ncbi:MAG: YfiR family protein, partial [bacterium]|nr:YfiR family protein [bacterium]
AGIFHIAKFTTWDRESKPDKPLIISLLGKVRAGNDIKIPGDKRIHKKKILVKKISKIEEIEDSHIVFIMPSERDHLDEILDYIDGNHLDIITIGDAKGFGERGVIINFYYMKEKNLLHFEINCEAEKKSSISFDAILFELGALINCDGKKRKSKGGKR